MIANGVIRLTRKMKKKEEKQQQSITSDIEDNDEVEEQDQEKDYTEDKSNNNLRTIYENLIVSKEDCVNHVKTRVIADLLKVKAVYSHFEIVDGKRRKKRYGKPYDGSNGRMTTKMMNKISNYYGRAIHDASREVLDEKRILRAERSISQRDTILKEKSKKRPQAIQSMADKTEYGSGEY
ncbi:unnamed protein product [Didymodactylos carnosus]|uniref:Uncharacterized protein n=1 Tax=Didymodactylos carnosus TaxID=1234261 RepID=A0A815VLI2_9BILA|nr:unnamed protein product [Didymodactylos carnosus]CAF1532032.1 unnamed protein product [Didymodactylos carnosus]CAF3626795.1 unnamed protein product [Didymodactylos carnosus]CAF4391423.1 unnamed protein product [Didymodactylos carnosus]